MKPLNHTKIEDKIIYHYKFSDLRDFLNQGKKDGNNGFILTEQTNIFDVYRGFGTIESPNTRLNRISIEHCEILDGKRRMPINYKKRNKGFDYKECSISIWDIDGNI